MKITIEDLPEGGEDEIIIRCRTVDEQLLRLIHGIRAEMEKLTVTKEDKLLQIQPMHIFYFEAVDNRVFAYLEKDVYETKFKLYELEKKLAGTDFFRASKSVIINLAKVKSFSPAFNGRFEACMKNGERLTVSRQYVPGLRGKLGL